MSNKVMQSNALKRHQVQETYPVQLQHRLLLLRHRCTEILQQERVHDSSL